MALDPVAFAVIGSSPLAHFLAGLLAGAQQGKVALVADPHSSFRLARGIDLSVAAITRPETWALLRPTTAETLRLLGKAGAKRAIERIDPLFAGETASGAAALSHIRHMAAAFDYDAEPVRTPKATSGLSLRFRDAVLLDRSQLVPLLENWLDRSGVIRRGARTVTLSASSEGTTVTLGQESINAGSVILADDAAITAHFPSNQREQIFLSTPALSMLTEPLGTLAAPVTVLTDRDLVLSQGGGRGVWAMGFGRTEDVLGKVGAHLEGYGALRRTGQSVFRALRSRDGAPVIGQVGGAGPLVIANLGWSGFFLVPALARWIAGQASETETQYFSARAPQGSAIRSEVSEYMGAAEPANGMDYVT